MLHNQISKSKCEQRKQTIEIYIGWKNKIKNNIKTKGLNTYSDVSWSFV